MLGLLLEFPLSMGLYKLGACDFTPLVNAQAGSPNSVSEKLFLKNFLTGVHNK